MQGKSLGTVKIGQVLCWGTDASGASVGDGHRGGDGNWNRGQLLGRLGGLDWNSVTGHFRLIGRGRDEGHGDIGE